MVDNILSQADARTRFTKLTDEDDCFTRTERKICEALEEFGCDREVTRSALDDEYERELEQEEEEEEERELPPKESPAASTEWDYKALIEGRLGDVQVNWQRTTASVLAETDYDFFKNDGAKKLFSALDADVRTTKDFATTLNKQQRSGRALGRELGGMDQYLRPVNSFLWIPAKALFVCVTDKEAGRILQLAYTHGAQFHKESPPEMKNAIILMTHEPNARKPMMPVNAAGESLAHAMDKMMDENPKFVQRLAALQLFNGESKFPAPKARDAVQKMLKGVWVGDAERKNMADMMKAIRRMRGRDNEYDRSDLDEILKGLGVETSF